VDYDFRSDGSYEWNARQYGSRSFSCRLFYQHEEGTYRIQGWALILRTKLRYRAIQPNCHTKPGYLFGKPATFIYDWRIQTVNWKVRNFGLAEGVEQRPTLILLSEPFVYEKGPERTKSGVTAISLSVIYEAGTLAVVVSFALLWLYRRAVRRSMDREFNGQDAAYSTGTGQPPILNPSNALMTRHKRLIDRGSSLYSYLMRTRRVTLAIFMLGGIGYACACTIVQALAGPFALTPLRFLNFSLTLVWPAVIGMVLIASPEWSTTLSIVSGYFALYAIVTALVAALSPHLTLRHMPELWLMWALMSYPATAVCMAVFNPRIRAVGPLVLSVFLFAATGFNLGFAVFYVFNRMDTYVRVLDVTDRFLGIGVPKLAWQLISLVPLALFGWIVLRFIGYCYRRKIVSEQSILVGALWLLFAFDQSFNWVVDSRGLSTKWILIACLPLVVYSGIVRLGSTLTQRGSGSLPEAPRLVVLRVFALRNKSVRMFRAIAKYWLYVGSIWHIAGPDLASSTVEPHEFLDFLSGRLSRRFIGSPTALELRLREVDVAPGRDGRYRVNDFFCHLNAWKEVLARLLRETDVVLMDLREFSVENSGCRFELTELINRVPVARMVLVTDDSTDQVYLDQVLQQAWHDMRPDSPNRLLSPHDVKQFRFSGVRAKKYARLVRTLCAAAMSGQPEEIPARDLARASQTVSAG
jgi:hypothetical protein